MGRRASSNAAQLLTPGGRELVDAGGIGLGVDACARDGCGERAQPFVGSEGPSRAVGGLKMAKGGQPADVVGCPCRQEEAEGRNEPRREPTSAEDDVDEGSPGPPVSVAERVNGLELGVGDGSLDVAPARLPAPAGGQCWA